MYRDTFAKVSGPGVDEDATMLLTVGSFLFTVELFTYS